MIRQLWIHKEKNISVEYLFDRENAVREITVSNGNVIFTSSFLAKYFMFNDPDELNGYSVFPTDYEKIGDV